MKPIFIPLLSSVLFVSQAFAEAFEGYSPGKLVAWCIVPFDAEKRGPEARAQLLIDLGIKRCAYDWRAEHVPTFEAEIQAYAKHGIEFFAFWGEHEDAFALFQQYRLTPQIWQTAPSPEGSSDAEKVKQAAKELIPLVERTRALGCPLGLYNHGGWGGRPENLVAVCTYLQREHHAEHVGIVYNFHHAHDEIPRLKEALTLMKPHLLCLNLNGMNDDAKPKILGIGKGKHDTALLGMVAALGYDGPIGIIDHREELDSKHALQENLDGLRKWQEGKR